MAGKLQTRQPGAGGDRSEVTDQTPSRSICTSGRFSPAALRSGGPGKDKLVAGLVQGGLVRCAEGKKTGKMARWDYWTGSISESYASLPRLVPGTIEAQLNSKEP